MRDWRGHRQALTLDEIGLSRFWIGFAAAIGFAVIFYLFFGGIRDITAVIVFSLGYGYPGLDGAPWEHPKAGSYPLDPFGHASSIRYVQNLFAAGIAVVVAQSVAFQVWLTHRGWREHPRTRLRRKWSLTWATMWAWLMAWIPLKLGQTYWLYVYLSTWSDGVEPELDLLREYGWVLALFVVVVFMEQWKGLRLTYRCGRWMLIAAAVSVATALLLAFLQPLAL